MGNTSSSNGDKPSYRYDKAATCLYNRAKFNRTMDIIDKLHALETFYSNIMTSGEAMPVTITVENFDADTEDYFNAKRTVVEPSLTEIDASVKSSHDAIIAVSRLSLDYNRPDQTERTRRKSITNVVNLLHETIRITIGDLKKTCDRRARGLY